MASKTVKKNEETEKKTTVKTDDKPVKKAFKGNHIRLKTGAKSVYGDAVPAFSLDFELTVMNDSDGKSVEVGINGDLITIVNIKDVEIV